MPNTALEAPIGMEEGVLIPLPQGEDDTYKARLLWL